MGETEDLDGRGCFNSEVIYDGERAANIQFDVEYSVRKYEFENNKKTRVAGDINIFSDSDNGVNGPLLRQLSAEFSKAPDGYQDLVRLNDSYDDLIPSEVIFDGEFSWETTEFSGFVVLDSKTFPISNLIFDDFELPELPNGLSWYIPELRDTTTDLSYDDHPINMTLQIVEDYKEIIVNYTNVTNNTQYTLPCLEEECVYALPGQPPYKITNNFPGLYDLYFVTGSDEEEQYLITEVDQHFSMAGNILARRVSKNVLMTNETFYSCEVPDYYFGTNYSVYGEQGTRCDVQNGYVCSPQDAESLINTWSNIDLDEIGYTEVTEYVEGMEFQPRTCGAADPCDVNELEYYVSPVPPPPPPPPPPGRNLVPNADFYMSQGNNIVDWIMYDGSFDTDSLVYRENETMTVPSGFLLKSAKIALHDDSSYAVTADNVHVFSKRVQ